MLPLADLLRLGLEIGKAIEDNRLAEAKILNTRLTVQLERRREIDDLNLDAIKELQEQVKSQAATITRLEGERDRLQKENDDLKKRSEV